MNDSCHSGAKVCSVSCCSLKIRRVENQRCWWKAVILRKGVTAPCHQQHIDCVKTDINTRDIDDRQRVAACLNRHVALKQSLTDALSIGRQSYRVK